MHGEYAYAGVVIVITRQRERSLHLQGGEGPDLGSGGVWYWEDPGRELTASINLVGLEAEGVPGSSATPCTRFAAPSFPLPPASPTRPSVTGPSSRTFSGATSSPP